jgi:hypothetical protein
MANMRKSPDRIEQLLPQMKSYRETWVEANRQFRAQKAVPVERIEGGFVAIG